MKHHFKPTGICPKNIEFQIENGRVFHIHFAGGCPGNLKILSKILNGWKVEDIISMCKGNLCGNKNTSCVDQFAQALQMAIEEEKQPN